MAANISLCSGYGGLDMAVERLTGNVTTVYAENNPAAAAVMAARFPDAVNLGDITAVDWADVARAHTIDTLTAGFSCQDISNAGPRKGITGERSRIWKNVAEAVRVIRPRLVFLENVAAIRSRGLDVVLADLAEIRFDAQWTCLRASDIGGGTPSGPMVLHRPPSRASSRHRGRRTVRMAARISGTARGGTTPSPGM